MVLRSSEHWRGSVSGQDNSPVPAFLQFLWLYLFSLSKSDSILRTAEGTETDPRNAGINPPGVWAQLLLYCTQHKPPSFPSPAAHCALPLQL